MSLQFGVSYMGGDYEYVRVRRWPFSIGRNPSNDLCLANSELISRRHIRVMKDADGYHLVATGRNPTFLNGSSIQRNHPVPIRPGDRIEMPHYLLVVRDTRLKDAIGATAHVEVINGSVVMVRRIASELGAQSWTAAAIQKWLTSRRGREIWIRHHQVSLCLPDRITVSQLEQRLEQFDELIADLDPQALRIDTIDPTAGYSAKT